MKRSLFGLFFALYLPLFADPISNDILYAPSTLEHAPTSKYLPFEPPQKDANISRSFAKSHWLSYAQKIGVGILDDFVAIRDKFMDKETL